jgi:hypothetical protein
MSRTHSEGLEPGAWKTIAVVILGPFMAQMDSTVVNVSLSFIKQELHSTIASAQWVVSGYLLALALMLPLNGWLVARLGAKRLAPSMGAHNCERGCRARYPPLADWARSAPAEARYRCARHPFPFCP